LVARSNSFEDFLLEFTKKFVTTVLTRNTPAIPAIACGGGGESSWLDGAFRTRSITPGPGPAAAPPGIHSLDIAGRHG
jgi:hypothetical protein